MLSSPTQVGPVGACNRQSMPSFPTSNRQSMPAFLGTFAQLPFPASASHPSTALPPAGDSYTAPPPKLGAPLPRSDALPSAGTDSTHGWKAAPLNKVGS